MEPLKECCGNCKTMDTNTYTVIAGKLTLLACNTKLIILEDKFKSGYECPTCEGKGYLNEACPFCNGTGFENNDQRCRLCNNNVLDTNAGKKRCPDCLGKGTKAGIIVPQTSERRPTTGSVVSCGPDVTLFKTGDHVLYGNYSGYAITYKNLGVDIRILDQNEVLCQMYITKATISDDMGEVVI